MNFRFAWKGYDNEASWYQECATIMFYFLLDMFEMIYPFKSEHYHGSDPTFYAICCGFKADKFAKKMTQKEIDEME